MLLFRLGVHLMSKEQTVRVYRVEHTEDRVGPFTNDVDRIPDIHTTHESARWHLRSMPTPAEDFFKRGSMDSRFSKQYIFAFPTMKRVRHWIRYKYRLAMMGAGFVVGVYDVRKVYKQSNDQVMFTRRVAEHVEDLPLVKIRKVG